MDGCDEIGVGDGELISVDLTVHALVHVGTNVHCQAFVLRSERSSEPG